MDAKQWIQIGPLLALGAIILAVAALGWDPALRGLTRREPAVSDFRFQPRMIAPGILLLLLIVIASALIVLAARAGQVLIAVVAPFLVLAAQRLILAGARWNYQRKLRKQVALAVTQLAAMTSGSASVFTAFRTVGRSSGWPLHQEWAWVEEHLNVPYLVRSAGRTQNRYADHAYALRMLAEQTPLELHARVLDHLATIYEQGVESHAPQRLRQLAEVIDQQASLQRELKTLLGRVRGEAYIICGAMGLILVWMLFTQTERIHMAFFVSPLGPVAMLWFGFWFVLPVVVSILLTRPPELPL